jgi:hypothetical protein
LADSEPAFDVPGEDLWRDDWLDLDFKESFVLFLSLVSFFLLVVDDEELKVASLVVADFLTSLSFNLEDFLRNKENMVAKNEQVLLVPCVDACAKNTSAKTNRKPKKKNRFFWSLSPPLRGIPEYLADPKH